MRPDTAGVIAPPPLIALAVVVLGLVLDWLLPAYLLAILLPPALRFAIGAVLLLAGTALGMAALGAFRTAGTPAEPWQPSRVLVTEGIFRRLRNPMYVGGLLLLAGIGILLASDWMLVLTVSAFVLIHFGVVRREERYLTEKFGAAYETYCRQVPRYGWPPVSVS
ncbi:MAG TPA: isoprenylcysteine carboxylmethyltransferase family protein [Pseudolabrys sp.]|nr:isoprenylcysteine carboxylmethyltransferase family protein [Pseudolabrys sp.]